MSKLFKPKTTDSREYERWTQTVTENTNTFNTELFAYHETAISMTLDTNHSIVNCLSPAITITTPATASAGKTYTIDNSSNGDITVSGSIEGETSQLVPSNSCMQIYYTGSSWRIR